MHPVQDFKDNFDRPALVIDAPIPIETTVNTICLHETESQVRNVCFVWPDGRKAFFNYAYLIVAEFNLNTEQNVIKLDFSSHSISLSGYALEPLFISLLDHLPRIITAIDPRYILTKDGTTEIVVKIIINKTDT